MDRSRLIAEIFKKKSYLCVGLDPDPDRIPKALWDYNDPILEFNRAIIEATKDYCVAYKPNTAFYEVMGAQGWKILADTLSSIPENHFTIADAKRGDIGNTSRMYANAFLQEMNFDAITVVPYMGRDSIRPFLEIPGKWSVVLALTSNSGAEDFQLLDLPDQYKFYQWVMQTVSDWGNPENIMFVVGATKADWLSQVRKIVPDHFLLVPGVGAQGGDLRAISELGFNNDCGLLVNASRSILYASSGEDFAEAAGEAAQKMQEEMAGLLAERLQK